MESESEDSHYFRLHFQLRLLRSTYERWTRKQNQKNHNAVFTRSLSAMLLITTLTLTLLLVKTSLNCITHTIL